MFLITLGLVLAMNGPGPMIPMAKGSKYDLTGTFTYQTFGHWKKGVCPSGRSSTGTLKIVQKGKRFTLTVLSGMSCSPASMCSFKGSISGASYKASNQAKVDNEGGVAANTLTFKASSKDAASGKDSSSYKHPSGVKCTWGFDFKLARKAR